MALTLTLNAAQNELTAVSDRRKHAAVPPVPAVTEDFVITVTAAGETKTYSGTRELQPAVPGVPASVDPITLSDSSGRAWSQVSDDGITTVWRA